ncbi:MAG TPA: YggS family pyridoxal phosphate-dependent enzyme [Burkholderiales bacterium]|nr:YggS family pyridoxal phosphate-dependent enzyme [Burkholderiales bacterium]
MTAIALALQAVRKRVAASAKAAGRAPREIQLVAISKTFPPSKIVQAHQAGQTAFGENYAQEGVEKILALEKILLEWRVEPTHAGSDRARSDAPRPSYWVASPAGPLLRPLEWHFIGPIQSNKTRLIAEHFTWVHSVDREKIAERLSIARPAHLPPLQVCIQVNVSGEATKSGISPGNAAQLARFIQDLPGLKLRGLMAVPQPIMDFELQRRQLRKLREMKDALVAQGVPLDTLSMGMSHDLEAAIWEGATLVRVGTAIFGERKP